MLRRYFQWGLLLLLASRAPAETYRIVDATGGFWPIAQQSGNMTSADQAAAFKKMVVSKFPELYTEQMLGMKNGQTFDAKIIKTFAKARSNEFRGQFIIRELVRELPAYIMHFKETFPDFRCDFPIYLMVSLGYFDGAGQIVAGHPALVFGVDTIAEIETLESLPVFATHELFHRYHFQSAGFSDDPGDKQAIWRTLWAEGLATYVSAKLNPTRPLADAMIFPRELAEQAAPIIKRLAHALRSNDAAAPALYAEYFEGDGVPPRSGYYVGYRIAEMAAENHTLYELAHLSGPTLHQAINDSLDQLASGTSK